MGATRAVLLSWSICLPALLFAETPIEAVKRIDSAIQAGHISYVELVHRTYDESPIGQSYKVAFDYARNVYRAESVSADGHSHVLTISNGGVEQKTANDDGLTDIRPASPRLNPLGRLEGYLEVCGGPSLSLGRGLSGLRKLSQIYERGQSVLEGYLSDGTKIRAYGVSAENHWLPTKLVRTEASGAVIGIWTFEGLSLSDGDRSVPARCEGIGLMSDGKVVATVTDQILAADFVPPTAEESALTWAKDKQFNDFRVDPPRFYHTKDLFHADGTPFSLAEILAKSQKENDLVSAARNAGLAHLQAEALSRRLIIAISCTLLLLIVVGAARAFRRRGRVDG